VMAEQGVAGLSVGEVARRMGIRPPSLYVYFPSKHALYDALFTRGAQLLLEAMRDSPAFQVEKGGSLEAALLRGGRDFVRWAVEHPAYSQLLFWRPVPGFTPTAGAYGPAVQLLELVTGRFAELQQRHLIRDDVAAEQITRDWTILISGVVSQQLSNAPEQSFDDGTFTSALPRLATMFAAYNASSTSSATTRKGRREHSR
jgi:AcrR family transcriptional regulator